MDTLISNLSFNDWIEIVAVIFGIVCVYLERDDRNLWLYPIGITSTSLYIYLGFEAQLYAQAALNIFYTALSIWGWILWTRKENKHALTIHYLSARQRVYSLLLFLLFWILIYLLLTHYTNSHVALADSFTAAVASTAMILFVRKKIENWLFWIVANIASMFLFYHQGLHYTSIQFFILLLLAMMGFVNWRKIYRRNKLLK